MLPGRLELRVGTFDREGGIALGRGGFSLDAFMAAQADGLYFDTTETDRFFQESTGPTLADDVGEAIGLALSQRAWNGQTLAEVLAGQSELAPNTAFNDTASCTRTVGAATMASVGGRLRLTATDTSPSRWSMPVSCTVGATYRIEGGVFAAGGGVDANISVSASSNLASSVAFSAASETDRTDVRYFVATATTMYVGGTTGAPAIGEYAEWDNFSVKLVPGKHGIQATGTLKPTRQTTGAKFDGSDDNWLTSYNAGAGENFLGCKTTVPSTLAATQVILGASGASANRVFLGINTSGQACGGLGSDSTTTIVGTSDLRNTEADVFLTFDGTTVRLIVNGVVEYEAAQNSTPTTTIPFRVGGLNNNGTAGSFYGGAVRQAWVGREYITASRARQIANA